MAAEEKSLVDTLKIKESMTKSRLSRHMHLRFQTDYPKSEAEVKENVQKFFAMHLRYHQKKEGSNDCIDKSALIKKLLEPRKDT